MFESLESRQFMSATMITDGTSNTAVQPPATSAEASKPVLTVRKAGGDQQDYYNITMENCMVSNYTIG